MHLTQEWLLNFLIKENKIYYSLPELNDSLYLNYRNIQKIEHIEIFSSLLVLYMEGNLLEKIENLEKLQQLSSLYLHENKIKTIENLSTLPKLNILNLQDNLIETLSHLDQLKALENLYLKRNKIGINGVSDFEIIKNCHSISTLDISENKIKDIEILDFLQQIPNLKILYLHGNEVCEQIPHYRKTIIGKLKQLKYLDDRPVFDEERQLAEAFAQGGLPAERELKKQMKKDKEEKHEKDTQLVSDMLRQREAFLEQRERENPTISDNNSSSVEYQESSDQSKSLSTYHTPGDSEDSKSQSSQQLESDQEILKEQTQLLDDLD